MELSKKEHVALFDDAVDFEVSKSTMAAKSEHRAWLIAKCACALTGLSWLALVFLMPLKTVEPYVVSVDKHSGHTEIVTVLENRSGEVLSEKAAMDNYWISNYVRWREVYDWYTLQQDYDRTLAFSSASVQKEYATIFEGEEALDAIWGKRVKANVSILSVVNDAQRQIATVRFEKTVAPTEHPNQAQSSIWVATLSYRYANDKAMSQPARAMNPLSFEVTSYRVDPERVR